LGGGAAGGLLVDEVFAAVLGSVAADGGGGVVDVAVEDERECMRALVELGGGGKPAAAGVGEFGLGEDFDGVVAGEIDRQRGDGGAEFLGDVIEAAVGALEEIDQEVLLAVGGNKDVAKFNRRHDPHPLISDPCSPSPLLHCSAAPKSVARIGGTKQGVGLIGARRSWGSVTGVRTTTALCRGNE
jgi:hypothetical protein